MKRMALPAVVLWMLLPATGEGQTRAPRMGVVMVVDGSGEFTTVADNLDEIIAQRNLPLAKRSICWCRGDDPAKDYLDYAAQISAARRLAAEVLAYRAAYPKEKIYLIGNSTGPHIVLAAAGMLPRNSVERIAVTAPMLCCEYDLRPALRASQGGIDVWYSPEDDLAARTTELLGNGDRRAGKSAAVCGFSLPPAHASDAALFKNLRQHRWNDSMSWSGHNGGHFGFSLEGFLDAYVVPALLGKKTPATKR